MLDVLEVIRVMAALAWSDGVMDQAEGAALRKLVDRAGLPDDARWTALNYVEFETRLGDVDLGSLGDNERRSIYTAAERLADVDAHRDEAEDRVLARLREALHVRREGGGPPAQVLVAVPSGPGPIKVRTPKARRKPARPAKRKAKVKPKPKAVPRAKAKARPKAKAKARSATRKKAARTGKARPKARKAAPSRKKAARKKAAKTPKKASKSRRKSRRK